MKRSINIDEKILQTKFGINEYDENMADIEKKTPLQHFDGRKMPKGALFYTLESCFLEGRLRVVRMSVCHALRKTMLV